MTFVLRTRKTAKALAIWKSCSRHLRKRRVRVSRARPRNVFRTSNILVNVYAPHPRNVRGTRSSAPARHKAKRRLFPSERRLENLPSDYPTYTISLA
ncbi:hypothetical protein PUN28_016153 [Cardiocondyla obscurior]|uniref:Uncharacterized protein n=1 Tax=Cardiocondyla obscurior TaxID=286306 RepID=A0AAW2EUV8_9HYME